LILKFSKREKSICGLLVVDRLLTRPRLKLPERNLVETKPKSVFVAATFDAESRRVGGDMAMTKKEKAYVEHLETLAAFRMTEKIEPDLLPPAPGDYKHGQLTRGWKYNIHLVLDGLRSWNRAVYKTCSSSMYHGNGWEKTSYQGSIKQYSTRKLALLALRHEVAMFAAERMREIDKAVEEGDTNQEV
jgi:hypothetical protein